MSLCSAWFWVTGEITEKSIARADKVIPALKAAFEAENVKAVAILIDPRSGSPVEAEWINNAVALLRDKHKTGQCGDRQSGCERGVHDLDACG